MSWQTFGEKESNYALRNIVEICGAKYGGKTASRLVGLFSEIQLKSASLETVQLSVSANFTFR